MVASNGRSDHGLGQFQHAMQAYSSGLDAVMHGFQPAMKPIMQANLEIFGLWTRRAQAYQEIPSRLAECRSPPDFYAAQMRFWQTAYNQYQDSSRKVVHVYMQAVPELQKSMARSDRKPERDYITVPEASEPQHPDSGNRNRRAA